MSDGHTDVQVPAGVIEAASTARRVVALTGAGMSAESGIATFRDRDTGLWSRFDPMTLATTQAFEDDPDLVWAWYLWRIGVIGQAQPNPGHVALGEWQRRGTTVHVVTQNVDDLHERGGSTDVLHLHGELNALRCFDCGTAYTEPVEPGGEPLERIPPPTCAECGGNVRPGVVWFGEMLPPGVFDDAVALIEQADLVLVIGTSGMVYPAAGLPGVARGAGVPVVEINPDETDVSDLCDIRWRDTTARALPALLRELA